MTVKKWSERRCPMPRRGENIYKRKDGRWEGRIAAACLSGKRKYRSVYGKTYGEVKKKMEEVRWEKGGGSGSCRIRMEEAVGIWYADKKEGWKESTYAAYRQIIEKYILPELGDKQLCQIDARVLHHFISEIRTKSRKKKLSGRYQFYICGVVLRIMSHIRKKTGLALDIPENPIGTGYQPPALPPDDVSLSKLENYLLKNIADDTCLGILTALHSGLRIGELCALTWEDIDLEKEILHIRNNVQRVRDYDGQKNKTKLLISNPKTACSVRDIPIPPALSGLLKNYRRQSTMPLVSGARGKWMDPRTLQYRFGRILEECGLGHFKFHMLRHAFATRCMEKGFDSKSLSEILGHSSIQITLNLYVHSTMQQKRRLMDRIETYTG